MFYSDYFYNIFINEKCDRKYLEDIIIHSPINETIKLFISYNNNEDIIINSLDRFIIEILKIL